MEIHRQCIIMCMLVLTNEEKFYGSLLIFYHKMGRAHIKKKSFVLSTCELVP